MGGIVQKVNYDNPGNFVFDSGQIEVSVADKVARLLQDPDIVFASVWTSSFDADFGAGDLTATPSGVPSLSKGADLGHTGNNLLTFVGANAAGSLQIGTIRFKLTPQWAGITPTTQTWVDITGAANANQILIQNELTTGDIRVLIRDSSGAVIVDARPITFSATAGTGVVFEFNYDLDSGDIRLFKDGVQQGTIANSTGTRTSAIDTVGLGSSSLQSLFSIEDFAIFSAVQHVTDYTVQALDLTDPNLDFAATFELQLDADVTLGSASDTATVSGIVPLSDGELVLRDTASGSSAALDYATTSNVDGITQVGTFKFKLRPDFTGTVATAQHLFTIENSAGNQNLINLQITNAGALLLTVNGQNGAAIIASVSLGVFAWVKGTEVEFELNLDITTGATRLFLDGVQQGTTQTQTGNRNTNIDTFQLGNNAILQKFAMSSFVVYDTVQHTADFETGGDILFTVSNPTIRLAGTVDTDALLALEADITASGLDEIRVTVEINGVEQWFDGASWVASNLTLAETNTVADVNTNLSSLDLSAGVRAQLIVYIHSGDGITTPSIESYTLERDFTAFLSDQTAARKCGVHSFVQDSNGNPLEGVLVAVSHAGFTHGVFTVVDREETVTDVDGFWEVELVETETINAFPYTIVIGGNFVLRNVQVPDLISCDLSQLVEKP